MREKKKEKKDKSESGTVINQSVDSEDHKPLQPLDKFCLTGTDGVLLAHPPLHHLVELIAGHRAHPHQEGVGLGQREPTAACGYNIGIWENSKWALHDVCE